MKKDFNLGKSVQQHLIDKMVETPLINTQSEIAVDDYRIQVIKDSFENIMVNGLGLDLEDDSLRDTPRRVAEMFVKETFSGLDYKNFPKATAVENKMRNNNPVLVKDITLISSCEHHFVTINGFCHVVYEPNEKVLGLSKINRIVKFFARRPQIQERLNAQIAHAIEFITESENVGVFIDAEHFCVKQRGVEDTNSSTITYYGIGKYKDINELKKLL